MNKQLVGRENYIKPGELINLSADNVERDEFKRAATRYEKAISQKIGENYIAHQMAFAMSGTGYGSLLSFNMLPLSDERGLNQMGMEANLAYGKLMMEYNNKLEQEKQIEFENRRRALDLYLKSGLYTGSADGLTPYERAAGCHAIIFYGGMALAIAVPIVASGLIAESMPAIASVAVPLIKAGTSGVISGGFSLVFQAIRGEDLDFAKAGYDAGISAGVSLLNWKFNPAQKLIPTIAIYELGSLAGYSGKQFLFEKQTWEGYWKNEGWVKAALQATTTTAISASTSYLFGPVWKDLYGKSLFEQSYPTYLFLNLHTGFYGKGFNMIWDYGFSKKNYASYTNR
ncbi:MAG: hypothetical protein N2511_08270 [Thermodesulfovibrionales bacterium]|nr:hypothetical protein [Thermodesulfovibrionales bacterium]